MTMGPICIAPELKRKGYGKILLDYSLEKADLNRQAKRKQRHLIESSRIWRRKNFRDRFLNDEKRDLHYLLLNGRRIEKR